MRRRIPTTKDEFDEAVVQTVEGLLADMGWGPTDLARKIYGQLGHKGPKSVEHYFNRKGNRRIPAYSVAIIAEVLGVDPGYILQYHDNLEGTLDPDGLYALRRQLRQLSG